MQAVVTVEGRTLGRKAALFADWSIPLETLLPGGAETLTLRELIVHLVLEEVDAFQKRQQERRLVRVLSRGEIEQGVAAGKVDMGGKDNIQVADAQAAA